MTVITKSLGEKKSDNLEEPLVENIVVEHADEVSRAITFYHQYSIFSVPPFH